MDRHEKLFEDYVKEMREAKRSAEAWWQALLASEYERIGSWEEAERQVRDRWPFGPTSHPRVIATFRKYFIACERLNEEIELEEDMNNMLDDEAWENDWCIEDEYQIWEEQGIIPPNVFLREMLMGRYDDLEEFLTFLVFNPIGIENDHCI